MEKKMKLHLLIDSTIRTTFSESDIVIISPYNNVNIEGCYKLIKAVRDNVLTSEEVYQEMQSAFKDYETMIKALENTIYDRFLLTIYSYLNYVKDILLKYNIDEIVLYDGSMQVYCMSTGAEGEGERDNYKTNWLINAIIYQCFCTRKKITWINKRSALIMSLKNYLQHFKEVGRFLFSNFVGAIRDKEKSTTNFNYRSGYHNIVSIVDLPLQYRHLRNLFEGIQNLNWVSLTTTQTVLSHVPNFEVVYIGKMSIFEIAKIVFRTYKIPLYSYKCNLFSINSHSFTRELRYLLCVYNLRKETLKKYLLKNRIDSRFKLVTNTTVGVDLTTVRDLCKELKIKHYNFQYVSMDKTLYPDLDLAGRYYLYSKRTYDLYKTKSNCYHLYFPTIKKSIKKMSTKEIVFTIFMQPDEFVQDYIDYMNELFPILKNRKNIRVIVKPHYRQNCMGVIESLVNQFEFTELASNSEDCSSIIMRSDLCMSIHSSVLFETLTLQVPSIIYNRDHKYDTFIHNNDACYPEVNFEIVKAIDTMKYLDNIQDTKSRYDDRLQKFMESIQCKNNIELLLENY